MLRTALISSVVACLFTLLILPANAQISIKGTADVGISYTVTEENIENGDVMVTTEDKGIIRATESYSNRLFGVIQAEPVILFRSAEATDAGRPIAQSGIVEVAVTTLNGPIKQGSYLTSSEISGKAKMADRSGYVIGIAMTNFPLEGQETQKFTFEDKEYEAGKIPVALKIEYAEITTARNAGRLLEYVGAALFKNIKDTERFAQTMRYFAAGVVVVLAFGVGYATFSKGITKGIEAIGRNPLARSSIYISIVMNIFFTILTTAVGIGAAFLILRL